ncbi:MAG: PD-(D/E)XK nuclease family protein [Actinobacteria bacterium]|nr:PD-(D/E)XK nuclease family protein [Actinomycetota bacterium]
MKLSYSAISSYQTCPLQYRIRYVEGGPALPGPALSFGHSLHEALEWFYSVPTPDPCSLPDLLDYLDVCWSGEGYDSPEEEAKYFCQAKSALEIYYRNYAGDFRIPAALEYKFRIDVGFCELSGVIDRLDKDPEGGFEIVDYKTNRRLPPAWRLKEDLQLPIYHIATERIWEVAPEKVTFHYLLMNHRHSLQVTPERARRTLEVIEEVVRGIEAERFEPRRNNLCPWCDFLGECPHTKGKPPPARRPAAPPLDIGQAVDELVTTHEQVANKLSRIEGFKRIVEGYLHERSLERVGGSRGVAYMDEDGVLAWGEAPQLEGGLQSASGPPPT